MSWYVTSEIENALLVLVPPAPAPPPAPLPAAWAAALRAQLHQARAAHAASPYVFYEFGEAEDPEEVEERLTPLVDELPLAAQTEADPLEAVHAAFRRLFSRNVTRRALLMVFHPGQLVPAAEIDAAFAAFGAASAEGDPAPSRGLIVPHPAPAALESGHGLQRFRLLALEGFDRRFFAPLPGSASPMPTSPSAAAAAPLDPEILAAAWQHAGMRLLSPTGPTPPTGQLR